MHKARQSMNPHPRLLGKSLASFLKITAYENYYLTTLGNYHLNISPYFMQ